MVFTVGLSRLLSYNPQSQKAEIESARRELGDDLDAAQEEILQIVLDNKRKFDQTVRTRKSDSLWHSCFSQNHPSFQIMYLIHITRHHVDSNLARYHGFVPVISKC